jgi:S-adenosylmethionine:tRNA ribosyltransferase-isomerase
VQIPHETLRQIEQTKQNGGQVWALGTTVTRALESWPRGHFQPTAAGLEGMTDIFILPGFEYKVVDVLMTNFHQPKSTLLALVVAFAGFERTFEVYRWAIEKQFRLFSYGDLSVWKKQ